MRVRSVQELRPAGSLPWFEPALSRLSSLATEPDARLSAFFEPGSPIWISRAPGRLDVMGGIADYSGATVLELPLDRATWALLQRQAAPRIYLAPPRGPEGGWGGI